VLYWFTLFIQLLTSIVGHLYHYFDVNGKAHELMKWAIEGDVATASKAFICKVECLNMLQLLLLI
jgi:hypothetical protein